MTLCAIVREIITLVVGVVRIVVIVDMAGVTVARNVLVS